MMNSFLQIYLIWLANDDRIQTTAQLTPEVFTVEFPSYIGWSHGARWCLGGVSGGLQNVVKQLLQNDIRLSDAQRLKDSYLNRSQSWRRNNTRPGQNLRTDWLHFGDRPTRNEDIANNLMGVARVLPVFRDLIDFTSQNGLGSKLRLFAKKVCTLFQVEADIPGLARAGTPFSCALIDAFQTGVACDIHQGESDLTGHSVSPNHAMCDQYEWWQTRANKMFNQFPQETCHARESSLQSLDNHGAFKAFKWHQPGIILPLAMEDLLFRNSSKQTSSLPRVIPAQVRDAELLTYLALYRGLRRVYEVREEFENCQDTNIHPNSTPKSGRFVISTAVNRLLETNDIIPGWKTVGLINLAQVSRNAAENVAVGIETPLREQKELNDDEDIRSLPPLYIPDLIRELFPSRNNVSLQWPTYMRLPTLGEVWGIRRPRTAVKRSKNFWEQIDDTTRNAVKTAWRDIKALVNDPINVYKAVGDMLTAVSLPYMRETQAETMRSLWSTWTPRKILESAADLLKITQPVDIGKQSRPNETVYDENPVVSPFLFISARRDQPCEISVGVRGTANFNEWLLDFTFWITPDPVLGHSHKGIQLLATTIWPTLRVFLEEHSEKHHCTCAQTRVIFYGHSLGAAVAQQLALRMALLYNSPQLGREIISTVPTDQRRRCEIKVDAILFAPVRQFGLDGVEMFNRIINGRILIDVNDPLTYIPCPNEYWPRCGRGHMSPGGSGRDFFPDHSAVVWLDVDFLTLNKLNAVPETVVPQESSTLVSRLITTILPPSIHKNLPTGDDIKAAHICSHSCALSSACLGSPKSSFRWWCEDCPVTV